MTGEVVELRKQGHEWKGLCPFHQETTPSFGVNPEKDGGVYHCFGCGKGGDLFSFVQEYRRVDFPAAVEYVAERYTSGHFVTREATRPAPRTPEPAPDLRAQWRALLPLIDHDRAAAFGCLTPETDSPAAAYLRTRGISPMFPLVSGVKYAPRWCPAGGVGKPAVVFPFWNRQGCLVNLEGRCLDGLFLLPDGRKERYLSARGGRKKEGVFLTPEAFRQPFVVLVEGAVNALSLAVCGVPAVATCGASNRPEWLPQACRGKVVYTAFDPDAGGEAGTVELARALAAAGIRSEWFKPPEDGIDWNDCLVTYGQNALRRALADVFPHLRAFGR